MSMNASQVRSSSIAEINVTPMADIMIVLLIIFMVMTPLIAASPVTLPAASTARESKDGDRLVVTLESDATTLLDQRRVETEAELLLELTQRLASQTRGSEVVYIEADEALSYAPIRRVVGVCRRAGAVEVALLTRHRTWGRS